MAALAQTWAGGEPPSRPELADIVRAYGAHYRCEHALTAPQHKALRGSAPASLSVAERRARTTLSLGCLTARPPRFAQPDPHGQAEPGMMNM
jgi:hypothetical protein